MNYSDAITHFKKVDPVLYQLSLKFPLNDDDSEFVEISQNKYFEALCETIVSQQLSVKVADVIWGRVLSLFSDQKIIPSEMLQIPDEKFRECGCSYAKIKYLKNLANAKINYENFSKMHDEEIVKTLVAVKGIGPWTAEMFLMFVMNRPDIFSYGDLGLKNAIKKLPDLQSPEIWSPYRTYACRILWKSLENK